MVRCQWREFGQDTGVTPLLFTMSVMGFLMTTESQDLGLTSHPKDGAFFYVSSLPYWFTLQAIRISSYFYAIQISATTPNLNKIWIIFFSPWVSARIFLWCLAQAIETYYWQSVQLKHCLLYLIHHFAIHLFKVMLKC